MLFLQSNASGSFFFQKCINFVEQRLKFSHFEGNFEGSIIPLKSYYKNLINLESSFLRRVREIPLTWFLPVSVLKKTSTSIKKIDLETAAKY